MSQEEKAGASKTYKDVSPLTSDSESDTDPAVQRARNSTEVAGQDRDILHEEEERENLLYGKHGHSGKKEYTDQGFVGNAKRKAKQFKKKRYGSVGNDENGELMYEMEEGGPHSDISSQASMSSVELDKLNLSHHRQSRRRRCATCGIITVTIILLFFIFAFGAYKMSRAPHTDPNMLLSNGTNDFAPTTILISLDGFRADFLTRGITPTLNQFIAEGVSPKYMYPSFPSLTFPNHFSIVTGLYPESHGIVGNTFFDPIQAEEFHYGEAEHSMQPKWWAGGEPIWVTAEKENVVTGIHMWPGSEAGMDYSPTYVDKYNGSELLLRKTARILELIDLPDYTSSSSTPRPQLIAAYVPVVDTAGHAYGPNSTEIMDTISHVDTMLHNIFTSLGERNLTNIVNVIVVSDHGMATTSTDRLIQLDDIIDMSQIEHSDGWPLNGLRPKDPAHIKPLYDTLKAEADNNPNFDVYLRDEDMPDRFHFQHNQRIAPLWIVPKVGWAIVPKKDFDVARAKEQGTPYDPRGLHGYDNEHPLMRAIFVARGPAFPHEPNSRIDPFQNTEVYNILCDTLGLEPKPNNGTIRLPFKTTGLHGDGGQGDEEGESPEDLPGEDGPEPEMKEGDESKEDDAADDTESQAAYKNFWSYMKAKLHKAMDWAHGIVEKLKNPKNKNPSGEEEGP